MLARSDAGGRDAYPSRQLAVLICSEAVGPDQQDDQG